MDSEYEVEVGFPHSEILGSKLVRSSPRLIAAYHVLHRLSAPRHPPNALKALDHSHDRCPPRPDPRTRVGLTLIRKTWPEPLGPSHYACRTHRIKGAVTPSLVAGRDVRLIRYVPSSRCQTPARDPAAASELLIDSGRVPASAAAAPGGARRDRTDDLMLAKHALSQLSYAPTGKDRVEQWWAREDLNFRPHAYQARALTN